MQSSRTLDCDAHPEILICSQVTSQTLHHDSKSQYQSLTREVWKHHRSQHLRTVLGDKHNRLIKKLKKIVKKKKNSDNYHKNKQD